MDSSELIRELARRGYKARLAGIERVAELSESIQGLNRQGCFGPEFYQKELAANLKFDYAAIMPDARSVIILAASQPPTRVRFGTQCPDYPPDIHIPGHMAGKPASGYGNP